MTIRLSLRSTTFLLLGILLLAGCQAGAVIPAASTPATQVRPDWGQYFDAYHVKGGFVLYDLNRRQYTRYNPERCATRFLPASTFKVMNALVGLETGVIPDADYVIRWDGNPQPIASWNQDHTLRTAMQNSVVWYYQEMARRIGKERMQQHIDAVHYGNQDISGNLDSFWLDGGLRISPDEQIDFLKRLYAGELPFSKRTMSLVKDILVVEKTGSYTLRAKTGWAARVRPQTGWYVGYLEREGNAYFFANNYESDAPDDKFGAANAGITRAILQEMGLMD